MSFRASPRLFQRLYDLFEFTIHAGEHEFYVLFCSVFIYFDVHEYEGVPAESNEVEVIIGRILLAATVD